MQFKQIKLITLCAILLAGNGVKGFGENTDAIGSNAFCISREISNRNWQIIVLSDRFSNFVNEDDSDVLIELVFVLNMMADEDSKKFVAQLENDLNILNKTIKEVAVYNQFSDTLYELVQTKKGISKVLTELNSVVMKNYLAYLEIERKYAKKLLTTQDGIKAVKQMVMYKRNYALLSMWLDKYLDELKKDCVTLDNIYQQLSTTGNLGIRNKVLGLLENLRSQKEALG